MSPLQEYTWHACTALVGICMVVYILISIADWLG